MLSRTGHRGDVLAALSAPLLVVAVLAGLLCGRPVDQVITARSAITLFDALHTSHEVVTALQDERLAALPPLTGAARFAQGRPGSSSTDLDTAAPGSLRTGEPSASTVQARAATDVAVDRLEQTLGEVPLERLGTDVDAAVARARATLGQLQEVRRQVDAAPLSPVAVLGGYAEIIDGVVTLPADVAGGLADRRLAAVLTARTAVTALHEDHTEGPVVGAVLAAAPSADHARELSVSVPVLGPARERASAAVRALDLGEDARPLVAATVAAPGAQAEGLRSVMTALDREGERRAGQAADAALTAAGVTIGVAFGGLAVTGLSVLLVRRRTVDRRQLWEAATLETSEAAGGATSEATRLGAKADAAHVAPTSEAARMLATPDSADPLLDAVAADESGTGSPAVVRRRDLRPPKKAPWWSRRRRAGAAGPGRPVAVPSPAGFGPTVPATCPEPSPLAPRVQPLGHFARDDAAATGAALRPAPPADASRRSRHSVEPHPGRAPDGLPVSGGQPRGPAYDPMPAASLTQPAEATPHGPRVSPSPMLPTVPTQSPGRPVRYEPDVLPEQAAMVTTFTPQPTSGTLDDEVSTLLAQRADLAQQALSELSQLSAYRPAATAGRGPAAPDPDAAEGAPVPEAVDVPGVGQRTERDAGQVRSLLSSVARVTGSPHRLTPPVARQRPEG